MKRELIEEMKSLEIKIDKYMRKENFNDEELFHLYVKLGQYIEDNSNLTDKEG